MQEESTISLPVSGKEEGFVNLKNLKQNAKILRRICINKKLTKQSTSIQKSQEDLEEFTVVDKTNNNELLQIRNDLFDTAIKVDKILEKQSDAPFSFSVMFT